MERSRVTADVTLPRVPKQERSRRKQEALLQAAEELFAEPGFESVTADDIAAQAGYGTGTFYNYFANKTQVFLMVAGMHETAVAPTIETISKAISSGGSLRSVAEAVVCSIVEERMKVPWLRRTWLRLGLTDPDVEAVQRRIDQEWDDALAQVIANIVEAGMASQPTAGARAIATAVRVLVDSVGDEVVLRGTLTRDAAAATVGDLVESLLHRP